MSTNDYQCVLVDDLWHLTQEQANPPPILRGGAYTSCCRWAEFKRGYDRRRPTCPECLNHALKDEACLNPPEEIPPTPTDQVKT